MKQRIYRKFRCLMVILAICFIISSAAAGPASSDTQAQRHTPVVEVFQAAKDAVVNISSTQIVQVRSPFGIDQFFNDIFDLPTRPRQLKRTSVGSGFVLHQAGYIVTNAHVVARTAEQKVIFADQREFDAQVVSIDHEYDLAVLKIDPPQGLTPLTLGRSDDLMVGETAIAIGNPLGYQHTVTAGVISALDRTLELGNDVSFQGLIQTDASINPGNSGGPLLNVLGKLIGINTAIRGDAQNIGFAIPVDQLRDILPELLDVERRYRIYSGLTISGQAPCRVNDALPDSPAAQAGIYPGDVITYVDGQPVASGIDFHIAMIDKQPGDQIRLTLAGQGPVRQVAFELAPRAKPDGAALLWRLFGVQAEAMNPKMARAMGIQGLAGLMVTRVEPDSPADHSQFQRGDVIVHIGRQQATSLEDVGELLELVKSGQKVRVTVLRVTGRMVYRMAVNIIVR